MAKYTGNALEVVFNSATITQNLLKAVEISQTIDTHESSGAGDTDKTYLAGKKSHTVRIDAWDDESATNLRSKFAVGTEATLEVYPQGNSSGKPKLSMTAIVTDITLGVPHDGVVPVTVALRVNGAVTESTVV
jgi:predicted secreted protein